MLKLHGKSLDAVLEKPTTKRLRELLAKLPKDEVFDTQDIAKKVDASSKTLGEMANLFPQQTQVFRHKRYWGCEAAIRELRKRYLNG
jgi:hypothetical protein